MRVDVQGWNEGSPGRRHSSNQFAAISCPGSRLLFELHLLYWRGFLVHYVISETNLHFVHSLFAAPGRILLVGSPEAGLH